ncbi:MAG: hypothetical protein ACIAQU_04305 [Phycisphaerales bacterium JB064]
MSQVTDAQGSGDIIDPRGSDGRFQKGNQAYKKRAVDPETNLPLPKDAGMVIVRKSDGTLEKIPLTIAQLERAMAGRILDQHKDYLEAERQKILSEADARAKAMFDDMIEQAGGDPMRLIMTRVATHVQTGKMMQVVDSIFNKASEGNAKAQEMVLKLTAQMEESAKNRGGDSTKGLSDEDRAEMDRVLGDYAEPEKADDA